MHHSISLSFSSVLWVGQRVFIGGEFGVCTPICFHSWVIRGMCTIPFLSPPLLYFEWVNVFSYVGNSGYVHRSVLSLLLHFDLANLVNWYDHQFITSSSAIALLTTFIILISIKSYSISTPFIIPHPVSYMRSNVPIYLSIYLLINLSGYLTDLYIYHVPPLSLAFLSIALSRFHDAFTSMNSWLRE